ncbi:MAG: hypothetical protein JXB39_09465 [Deltaproteobacteria bacterium]|nr:hypothetical protein [Deltaproteobacteria bacterium]
MRRDVRPDPAFRFHQRDLSEYRDADLNPYLKLHLAYGPPVLTADQAHAARGRWAETFGRAAPLHVEVGSGNGFFLAGMAGLHPDWNWLGLEIRFKRVVQTAGRIRAAGAAHARIARYDAFWMGDLFDDGEVSGLYVNHPDPWPKPRETRNRLLARPFAETAARLLASGAHLRVKTDSVAYVDGILAVLDGLPFEVVGRSDDIASEGPPWPPDDDVVSSYQRKFLDRQAPVHALWIRRL